MSPLHELAQVVVKCVKQGLTPVIVCDRRLLLEDDFYLAFCDVVHQHTGRQVRLDMLPHHRLVSPLGGFGQAASRRRLQRRLQPRAEVVSTLALSRVTMTSHEIVVGFASEKDELPSYAKPIGLAA